MTVSTATQRARIHSFDIDRYLNPLVPRPRLGYLPRPLSHFLGYRPPAQSATPSRLSEPSTLYIWIFSFLGGFIGIAIIANIYRTLPPLSGHDVPVILASFGAAAILEYNMIESPLAQPRNLLLGHFISSVIGVGITKLFQQLPSHQFEDLRWLAGAISVGAASATMSITKTVHPPAGASALLASTTPEVTALGWWLLALVVLGDGLMLASALLINNLYRRFPVYWWTPVDLAELRQHPGDNDIATARNDVEKGETLPSSDSSRRSSSARAVTTESHQGYDQQKLHTHRSPSGIQHPSSDSDLTITVTNTGQPFDSTANPNPSTVTTTITQEPRSEPSGPAKPLPPESAFPPPPSQPHNDPHPHEERHAQPHTDTDTRTSTPSSYSSPTPKAQDEIIIRADHILVPDWMHIDDERERAVLEVLKMRLRAREGERDTHIMVTDT